MSNGKTLSIGELVKLGWEKMKAHFWLFFAVLLIAFIIGGLSHIPYLGHYHDELPRWDFDTSSVFSVIWTIIIYVISLAVTLGLIKIALKLIDDQKATVTDLFSTFPFVIKYFLATIVYYIIVTVGMFLLIVPGVIWAVGFGLYPYFILEKNAGPIEALRLSWRTTRGGKWDLFGLGIVVAIINILGALCLLVGLFATLPVALIASAAAYRRLLAQTPAEELNRQ